MNEPDTTRILGRDSLAGTEDGSPVDDDRDRTEQKATTTATCCGWRVPRCPVTVEPVMFLAMFSLILQGPLSTQYLFDRMSQEVGFNRSRTSECGGNASSPPDPLQKVALFFVCANNKQIIIKKKSNTQSIHIRILPIMPTVRNAVINLSQIQPLTEF